MSGETNERGYTSSRTRWSRSRRSTSLVVFVLLLVGLLALVSALTLPTVSLLDASVETLVSTPPAVDPRTASHVGGLLVIAATSISLGVALAAVDAIRLGRLKD
jgi:hypothetical protein